MVKNLVNVELEKGKCATCRGPIDPEWTSYPSLGTKCRSCSFTDPEPEAFGPDNVDLVVESTVRYNPVLGEYSYHFNFRGSRVMVNGQIGTVRDVVANGSHVNFSGDDRLGEFVDGLGYWDLRRIYGESGGVLEPPPLNFPRHLPTKATLLDQPIVPVKIRMEDGIIDSVSVGDDYGRFRETVPCISMLNAFVNLYVRFKFGLAPNFHFEGGFVGNGFEVRNRMSGVGLNVEMGPVAEDLDSVSTVEELRTVAFTTGLLGMIYDREQSRPEVVKKDASVYEVVSTWVNIMETLLRYDWRMLPLDSLEDVWHVFCTMQDVLVNIIPEEELKTALE